MMTDNNLEVLGLSVQKFEHQIQSMKEIEKQYKAEKEKLLEAMIEHGVKKLEVGDISITRKDATTRKTFDKKLYEEDHGEISEVYYKTSIIKESLMIKNRGK